MIPTSYFASDLDGMIADIPSVAKWGTATFYCSTTPLGIETNLLLAGDSEQTSFECIFPVYSVSGQAALDIDARFPIRMPAAATFSNYRISTITLSQDGVSYSLIVKTDKRA